MIDQLLIARSYMEIDHVDLVDAGKRSCSKRALFHRMVGMAGRVRRHGTEWLRNTVHGFGRHGNLPVTR